MTKCFTQEDIKKWAFFSGDYNTVHFDVDTAKKNGLNDIIVQGMLYLQYSKLTLDSELPFPTRVMYRLKRPVYKDSKIDYHITKTSREHLLKIKNTDGFDSATGRVWHEEKPPLIKRASTEIFIEFDFITKQLSTFKELYPEVKTPWIIMDAFLFSVCFKYQHGDPFYNKSLKITKEPDKTKVVTFQVDQDIFISAHDFPCKPEDMTFLRFFYEDIDIIKQDYYVYSVLRYQVYYKELLLYQSSMGSVTRAFEAQSNAIKNRSDNANR